MQTAHFQQVKGQSNMITGDNRPKWFNLPVNSYEDTLKDIRSFVPEFERRPFALTQPGNERTLMNKRLDTIVRKPFCDDQNYIPVGVVSKEYTLVPHMAVLDMATQALEKVRIAPEKVQAKLEVTEYGERMALSIYLPKKFSFDPGDNHPMKMRLECFNSVDGSTRFRALMGWFRVVCSNQWPGYWRYPFRCAASACWRSWVG